MDIDCSRSSATLVDPYHVPLIRNQLPKNIGALFPDIRNEIIQSFSDEIGLTDSELSGVSHPIMSLIGGP